ncbi:SGNH/GDSL hydrolase family protein [Tolypothrix campylonemoides VB511288]|nr:SGNH/GDSL hydrolase family protein [Tolypothrix campylonemoides VB511288]
MKKELVTAGFALLSLTVPLKASAADFSQFVVFGDSLSDTGNLFNVTQGLPTGPLPPDPPYFQGRFSNDKIWVDYLGDNLGLPPTTITDLIVQLRTTAPEGVNYAFGGSLSGQGNFLNVPGVPGVLEQVGSFTQPFLTNNQKVDPNGLYAVWGGANDYLFTQNPDVTQTVKNVSDSVGLLAQAGAKNILVFNLPDLGKTPLVSATGNTNAFTTLTNNHNAALAAALGQLSNTPGVNIIPVDVDSLFNRVLANPSEFGFTNVTAPCVVGDLVQGVLTSVCNNPNDFLFFDSVHPSSSAHKLVADTALASIRAKSVPERSTALSLLALGVGAAAMLQRKQKNLALTPVASQVVSKHSSRAVVER